MTFNKHIALACLMVGWFITTGSSFSYNNITWKNNISNNNILPPPINAPKWAKNAIRIVDTSFDIKMFPNGEPPMIAIVIDDMGINKYWSKKAEELPSPITLSYLPYAENLPKRTKYAHKKGHELMLHMPMEANNTSINPGPSPLMTNLSTKELLQNLKHNLKQFDGYIGINNHMGSKMSQDRDSLAIIMKELKKRELLYLDSKTTPISLGETIAHEFGLPTTHRDVFLDHIATPKFVANSLRNLERIALKSGTAIAIGHPKKVTITALEKWIPQMRAKGIRIVPVSEIIKQRMYDKNHPAQLVSVSK